MVADFSNDNIGPSDWVQRQLLIGSVACMFCIVFLGLKFKWFRAQLSFGEPKHSKSSEPVQGIGFKFNANADDFQSYRVISEFAQASVTVPPTQQNASTHQSKLNSSHSYSEQKLSSQDKNADATNVVEKPLRKSAKNTVESGSTQQLSANGSSAAQHTTQNKRRVRIQESPDKSGNWREESVAQVTNPMFETKNSAEEPKNRNKFEEEAAEDDLYSMVDSAAYSSQAASIFFGGRQLATEPPTARSNGFQPDSDNESIGSATSA